MREWTSRFGAVGLAATLCVTSCSGEAGGTADEGDAPWETDLTGEPDEAAGASATIRFVNLWLEGESGPPVDVYVDPLGGSERPLFENVGHGEVTAAVSIPADAALNVYRVGGPDAGAVASDFFLSSNDLEDGGPLTLFLTYAPPRSGGSRTGVIEAFPDTGPTVGGGTPARPVDGVLLVAYVSPANRVLEGPSESLTFGVPGQGCLRPAGSPRPTSGGSSSTLGGTAIITFDADPGVYPIAAYSMDDSGCAGTPRIAPVEVNVPSEGRIFLFAYGSGPRDLRLLPVTASGNHP